MTDAMKANQESRSKVLNAQPSLRPHANLTGGEVHPDIGRRHDVSFP